MKIIGLIGGMSWESTQTYYQLLNRMTREQCGGLHSARIVMWSFDFADIAACQERGDWQEATRLMVAAARKLENAGADCIVICTNTMHKMANDVASQIKIPLLHIADATAEAIQSHSLKRPLLLATRYTMEQDFYKGRLTQKYGLDVMVPETAERDDVHRIIYDELCQGEINPASKQRYLEIVDAAVKQGADCVIFGCTEVGLLLCEQDLDVPAFDTTRLHARAALDFALG